MHLVQFFRQTKTLVLIYELIAGNIYNKTFKFLARIYRIFILKFYSFNVNAKISELSKLEDQKFSHKVLKMNFLLIIFTQVNHL